MPATLNPTALRAKNYATVSLALVVCIGQNDVSVKGLTAFLQSGGGDEAPGKMFEAEKLNVIYRAC